MRTNSIAAFTFALGLVFISTVAQAQTFVYPEKGQSPEQQQQDEGACYQWAKQQTGIDPTQQMAAAAPPPPEQGGALRGAGRGAALGAVGGAIGGDAGKGAAIGAGVGAVAGAHRRRQGEIAYREQVQQQSAQQQQSQQTFNRAYSACLGGKGYKVG
jgi:hypothetical protein